MASYWVSEVYLQGLHTLLKMVLFTFDIFINIYFINTKLCTTLKDFSSRVSACLMISNISSDSISSIQKLIDLFIFEDIVEVITSDMEIDVICINK